MSAKYLGWNTYVVDTYTLEQWHCAWTRLLNNTDRTENTVLLSQFQLSFRVSY